MVSLVARLSTYELRTHYIFYSVAHTLLRGRDIAFTINASREENRVLIPFMEYVRAMDYYAGEDIGVLLSHAVHGLAEEGLIDSFASGSPEVLAQLGFTNVPGAAVAFQTSALGVELFLWAHGLSGTHINDFLNVPIASEITSQMNLPSHASVAGELPPIPDDVMAMAQELQTMVAGALAEGVSLPPYPMRPPE